MLADKQINAMTKTFAFPEINKRIRDFEKKHERQPNSVCLLAVSKGQDLEKIKAAYDAGQHSFGENYLQEALSKIEALSDLNIEWHFIGNLQRNKTKKIAEHFSWVQSVSSKQIAKRLNDHRPENLPPLNICIEINLDHEASKSGIEPAELTQLAKYCMTLPRLKLRGIMLIPPPHDNLDAQCKIFHQAYLLFESLRDLNLPIDTLSMGMSRDFEAAIAEGSTMVRIGSALFGERF